MDLIHNQALLAVISAALGVVSHLSYFIRGEHHESAPTLALLCVIVPALLFTGQVVYMNFKVNEAAVTTIVLYMSYFIALWTSMIIYRVFFHRLNKFPGPFMAKVSKIYHTALVIRTMDNYLLLDRWHQKYGPFVRTGPNEITIATPEAPMALLGPNSKCIKAAWYDGGNPMTSLHSARNRAFHDKRRKVWDKGFSAKALRSYEGRVMKYARSLVNNLFAFAGKPVNATKWLAFFGFDAMGDLAFGKSFGMLESGEKHFALKLAADGQTGLGYLGPLPWAMPILIRIPGLMKNFNRWVSWSEEQVRERQKMEVREPDVMSHLLEETKAAEDKRGDFYWLSGDSRLIIVAGSDTTSTTLTYIFYHLAKEPAQMVKLRAELKSLVKSEKDFDVKDVRDAEHLNATINESLRLHPPVPTGVYRLTPPEGIMVGDTYIPGDVTVITPNYTLGRLESCYTHADDFIPERWYSHPELLKRKDAFAPFSLGPYGCIGKQLALMELRTVITLLVLNFNVSFAPGEDGKKLFSDTKDIFTLALGDLKLVFTKIEKA